MKHLFIVVLLTFSKVLAAQDNTIVPEYVYCEIVGTAKLFSSKLDVYISYGQSIGWFKDNRIRNENGETIKFNSMIDAMNYMGERGWEFIQAYTVSTSNQLVYFYVLKRKLSAEDSRNYIPYIKRDFKK